MVFVNIDGNRNTVHTSTIKYGSGGVTGYSSPIGVTGYSGSIGISGTNITTTSNYGAYTIQPSKVHYNLLGEEIVIEGYRDEIIVQTIALINCIGWKYYEEIQKQGFCLFSKELKEIVDTRYAIYLRDKKINNILETK